MTENDRLLRLWQVLEILPISRSAWYQGIKAGKFPKPVKLGPRISAWKYSDIIQIIERGVEGDEG